MLSVSECREYEARLKSWLLDQRCRRALSVGVAWCEQVLSVSECREYEARLKSWQVDQQRQQVEFTITENHLDADLRLSATSPTADDDDYDDVSVLCSCVDLLQTSYLLPYSICRIRIWGPDSLQCFDAVGWAAGRASGL